MTKNAAVAQAGIVTTLKCAAPSLQVRATSALVSMPKKTPCKAEKTTTRSELMRASGGAPDWL